MAKPKQQKVLTQDHLNTLNKIIAATADTESYCADCEAAGIDVEPERRKNAEQADIAKRIKARFFPTAK